MFFLFKFFTHRKEKMEPIDVYRAISFILLFVLQGAQAFDVGDTIALLLGLVLGILGVFACLGCFSRRGRS